MQKPDFAAVARREFAKWYIDASLLEGMLDGPRKAGLEIAPVEGADPDDAGSA